MTSTLLAQNKVTGGTAVVFLVVGLVAVGVAILNLVKAHRGEPLHGDTRVGLALSK